MKYTINWLERKTTSTGKDKADCTLKNGEEIIDKVTIWADFPNFASLMAGQEINGILDIRTNGQYTNKTLKPELTQGWGGGKKQPSINISKLMDKKAENIAEAQGRKNDSIAYFNSLNSAIAFVGANNKDFTMMSQEEAYNAVLKVRDLFLGEWHKYEADPTKGKNPF